MIELKTQVEIFEPSGKWYSSSSIDMEFFKDRNLLIHDALYKACVKEFEEGEGWELKSHPNNLLKEGYMIVCVNPNHEKSHPIMLKNPKSE